jgi:hypothetical protein
MFESAAASAIQQLTAAREQLAGLDPAALSRDELLELLDILETDTRRQAAVSGTLIAELDGRGVASELGYTGIGALLAERLRIGRREAAARARLAADLGPRRALSGEKLAPRFPQVAAALAEGAISTRHATVITAAVDALPDRVVADRPELAAQVEPTLLGHARTMDPDRLAALARTVAACLNPDGQLAAEKDQQRRRSVTLAVLPDGSGLLAGTLTAEAAAVWQVVLDTLSRPAAPDERGQPDRRNPGQRRHDALADAGRRLLRSGTLPDAGGTPATVLLTLTLDQLETRSGLATTGHGGALSIPAALRLAADAQLVPVVLDSRGVVLHLGRARRTATAGQRLALSARDGGCSFPACDRPPDWCESHHVTPWTDGGPTDVNNLTLVCGFHHREHAKRGWAVYMVDGLPEWIPPRWIDPQQTPRRNITHHPPLLFPLPTQHNATPTGNPGTTVLPYAS